MKPPLVNRPRAAFTLLELLVVVAVIGLAAVFLIPALERPRIRNQIPCAANQRQMLSGLFMFSGDHQGRLPTAPAANEGGPMEISAAGNVASTYQLLTAYCGNPAFFLCPTEKHRSCPPAGLPIAGTNVSYFISLDASLTNSPSVSILTGDRHLESDGKPVRPGLFTLSGRNVTGWTEELHQNSGKNRLGVLGFGDGHVEVVRSSNLTAVVALQQPPVNRLAVP